MPPPKTKSEFQSAFADEASIPAPLLKLLGYQLGHPGEAYSGQFTIYFLPLGSVALCPETSEFLTVFGQNDGDDSLYAFWSYDRQSLVESPIVYLDSEGIDNALIADDFQGFLELLALDVDVLGYCHFGSDEDYPGTELNKDFQKWLSTEFGIEKPITPESKVNDARSKHPDFPIWIGEISGNARTVEKSKSSFWARLFRRTPI